MRESRYIILLVIFSLFLLLFGLGDMPLTDPDETFYAQTAKEMMTRNEWATPYIFDKPQFEKPPLYYWMIIASYKIFGVSEFSARLPSAIFAFFGILGTYFVARFIFSALCGFFSALILGTCVQYVILSHGCVTDMTLMVFILYSLLFFLLGWGSGKKIYYITAFVMAGFAVLTKGPIGLFIPGAIIFLYALFTRQFKKLAKVPIFRSFFVFLAVALPWYVLAFILHGDLFLEEFFGLHNLTRFLVPEHPSGISPFYYVPVVIGGFFPWSVFLPVGTYRNVKFKVQNLKLKNGGLFLIIWFLLTFIFFSVSRTKLVTYIFPLYPAIAIMVGRVWADFVTAERLEISLLKGMRISFFSLVVVTLLAFTGASLFIRYRYPEALPGAVIFSVVFILGLGLALGLLLKGRRALSFFTTVVVIFVASGLLVGFALPVITEAESSRKLSLIVKRLALPDEAIGAEGDHGRGVAFYTDKVDIVDIHPYWKMKDFVALKERVWCVMRRKHYDQLIAEKGQIVSRPIAESGKYVLINNNRK